MTKPDIRLRKYLSPTQKPCKSCAGCSSIIHSSYPEGDEYLEAIITWTIVLELGNRKDRVKMKDLAGTTFLTPVSGPLSIEAMWLKV